MVYYILYSLLIKEMLKRFMQYQVEKMASFKYQNIVLKNFHLFFPSKNCWISMDKNNNTAHFEWALWIFLE